MVSCFNFYFYFAPSTQVFLKISRKTFYKKKLALLLLCIQLTHLCFSAMYALLIFSASTLTF